MDAVTDIADRGLTRALAERARALRYSDLPADVRALARQCVLDYTAVAIAGASDPLVGILAAELQEQGGTDEATVIDGAARLPSASAALLNGTAGHALDFDDVNLAMPGHPSVAILPALLALAESRGDTGEAVLVAFVAGYELQCRIGRTISPWHYDVLGFHATATIGSFGAAAACAHLLGLNADTFATALGIAGTQAAGLKSMFGTMCKPLHAGKAAYHGLVAAKLAARGFSSRTDVLECPQGFAHTHSPEFHPDRAEADPPDYFHIRNNLFKFHAACYLTHAPIEAARKLREQHGFTPDELERINLRVDAACDRVCNIPSPATGLEAKFSLRQTTAMALAGVDTGGLTSYSAATATDPLLVALRDRIALDLRPDHGPTRAALTLELTGGARLTSEHDSGVPARDVVEQGQRLQTKFTSIVEPVLGSARARELIGEIDRLDSARNVRPMMALCARSFS